MPTSQQCGTCRWKRTTSRTASVDSTGRKMDHRMNAPFPLTPALSLGETENRMQSFLKIRALDLRGGTPEFQPSTEVSMKRFATRTAGPDCHHRSRTFSCA